MTAQRKPDIILLQKFITSLPKQKVGDNMSQARLLLIIATIVCFATGLWPIAIGTLLAFILTRNTEKNTSNKENQNTETQIKQKKKVSYYKQPEIEILVLNSYIQHRQKEYLKEVPTY